MNKKKTLLSLAVAALLSLSVQIHSQAGSPFNVYQGDRETASLHVFGTNATTLSVDEGSNLFSIYFHQQAKTTLTSTRPSSPVTGNFDLGFDMPFGTKTVRYFGLTGGGCVYFAAEDKIYPVSTPWNFYGSNFDVEDLAVFRPWMMTQPALGSSFPATYGISTLKAGSNCRIEVEVENNTLYIAFHNILMTDNQGNTFPMSFQYRFTQDGKFSLLPVSMKPENTPDPSTGAHCYHFSLGLMGNSPSTSIALKSYSGEVSTDFQTHIALTPTEYPQNGYAYSLMPPGGCQAVQTAEVTRWSYVVGSTTLEIKSATRWTEGEAALALLSEESSISGANLPQNGTAYRSGDKIGSSAGVLVGTVIDAGSYFCNFTPSVMTGLKDNTEYYLYLFPYHTNCSGNPVYNTTQIPSQKLRTYPAPPAYLRTDASTLTQNSFTVNIDNSRHYLLAASPTELPYNASITLSGSYSKGDKIGPYDLTVVEPDGSAASLAFSDYSEGTDVYLYAWTNIENGTYYSKDFTVCGVSTVHDLPCELNFNSAAANSEAEHPNAPAGWRYDAGNTYPFYTATDASLGSYIYTTSGVFGAGRRARSAAASPVIDRGNAARVTATVDLYYWTMNSEGATSGSKPQDGDSLIIQYRDASYETQEGEGAWRTVDAVTPASAFSAGKCSQSFTFAAPRQFQFRFIVSSAFNLDDPNANMIFAAVRKVSVVACEEEECPAPHHVTRSNLQSTSIDISWKGENLSYAVCYKPRMATDSPYDTVFTADQTCTLTGLTPNTAYQCMVIGYCEADRSKTSEPSSLVYFNTLEEELSTEKAYITLEAVFDYGDGSGYQIVLDKDHTAGDNVPANEWALNSAEFVDDADFSVYEYRIPQDATGSYQDSTWVMPGNSVTLEIEPGVYDFFVTNPSPHDGLLYIVEGEDARGNDIVFRAGIDYIFSIGLDPYDYGTAYCVARLRDSCDIALEKIVSPVSALDLGAEESISVLIKNMGTKALSKFTLSCQVNNQDPIEEEVVLENPISRGQTAVYTLSHKWDMSALGKYSVKVRAEMEGETFKTNNTVTDIIWHYEPVVPPFICRFDDKDEFETWKTFDGDHNGDSWRFRPEYSCDEDFNSGCAMVFIGDQTPGKTEYLMHVAPFQLNPGTYHISYFFVAGALVGGNTYHDYVKILYGTTPDIEQMQVLASRDELYADDWTRDVVNFEITQEGLYYFAVSALNADGAWTVYIDNFELAEGIYEGPAELTLKRLFRPLSSCELDEHSRLGVQINNTGYADVNEFTLMCVINGTDTVRETFNRLVKIRDFDTVYFTAEFDFSQEKEYNVEIQVDTFNTLSSSIVHFGPVSLPFHTDFMVEADRRNWVMETEGAWQMFDDPNNPYSDNMFWSFDQGPLYSRCVEMETGKSYRFRMSYAAGIYISQYSYAAEEPFAVLCGPSGSDMDEWDTVVYLESFTNEFVVDESYVYTAASSGNHTFAIVPIGSFPLRFKDITITEVMDYDLRMASFDALPRYIPEEHINCSFEAGFDVENTGKQPVNKAHIRVSQVGAGEIGTREFNAGASGNKVSPKVDINPMGLKIGDEVTLRAMLGIGGLNEEQIEDENGFDNVAEQTLTVTDEVLAYESLSEEDCSNQDLGVGAGVGSSMYGGAMMYFPVTDTLTGISVMWGETEEGKATGLRIIPIYPESGRIGATLFEDLTLRKNAEAGEQLYTIPAFIIPAGYYLVAVLVHDYSLVCEKDPFSVFYALDKGKIYAQAGLGIPGIRAHFGHGAVLSANEGSKALHDKTARVRLYPNPVNADKAVVNLQAETGVEILDVEIMNIGGRRMPLRQIARSTSACTLNVSGLSAGLYFARIRTNAGVETVKFIVR